MARPLLLLELNELCPTLLDELMASGDLPNFSRLHRESLVHVTDAEEPQGHLNPWVQWVTAHTGASYEEHGVFKLGEGDHLKLPTVADVVGAAGEPVWLCGPMNVVPTMPVRGRWLPDPWNPDPARAGDDLDAFATFVRANVQEHTNAAHRLGGKAYARFGVFMARHGLRPSTVRAVVDQLVGERAGRRERWRRAALLDRFQWDLFAHLARRERPTFATYFSNTTAHYQHTYWRYMDPEPFTLKPTVDEVRRFGEAVRFGYQEMDRLVGQALRLAGDDTTLVLCTALSQQPYLVKDEAGGSRFYRPADMSAFVGQLGLRGVEKVASVMSSEFHVYFRSEAEAAEGEAHLKSATVGDLPAFRTRRVGRDVFTGFAIVHDLPADALIEVPAAGVQLKVHEHLYRSETAKSGYHHPDGALWVRTPDRQGAVIPGRVPLRSVAPTLLRLMDLEPPASMRSAALPSVVGERIPG
ncbi:MAG: hypothetical protein ACSLFP_09360 [Acidimicrobiales bacterium]